MSIEIDEDAPIWTSATRWSISGEVLACPECGNENGLRFAAFVQDEAARGECPNRHYWDELRMPGTLVRDAYAFSCGLPTRYHSFY